MPETITSEFEAVPAPPQSNHSATAERPVVIQIQDHKAAGGGPRATQKIKWIPLVDKPDSEYAEHQIKVRVRYPDSINADYFNAGSSGTIRDGLKLVVLEHNGWIDPDSESDPPEILPPVDQKCTIDVGLAAALQAEETTYAVALKEARTEGARAMAETAHTKAVDQIHVDSRRKKEEGNQRCCFWDSVSQEEVILMLRAVTTARGKILTFLLETKPT